MIDLSEMLIGETRQMSSVIRYSSIPHGRGENVAEHSYYVCLYSWLLAHDLISDGYVVNMQKLLEAVIIHDLDECITGDIIRPVKYASDVLHSELNSIANHYAKKMIARLKLDSIQHTYVQLKGIKNTGCIEGTILLIADLLSVVSYCIERIRSGNTYMKVILRGAYENYLCTIDNPIYERYRSDIAELCWKYFDGTERQRIIKVTEEVQ